MWMNPICIAFYVDLGKIWCHAFLKGVITKWLWQLHHLEFELSLQHSFLTHHCATCIFFSSKHVYISFFPLPLSQRTFIIVIYNLIILIKSLRSRYKKKQKKKQGQKKRKEEYDDIMNKDLSFLLCGVLLYTANHMEHLAVSLRVKWCKTWHTAITYLFNTFYLPRWPCEFLCFQKEKLSKEFIFHSLIVLVFILSLSFFLNLSSAINLDSTLFWHFHSQLFLFLYYVSVE